MKKEITIGEFAKLMNVSVHQIRYFEEKGVLFPAYIDDNQYRMYGIDEIYRLAHILLLRKAGLSVQAIRDWSDEGTPDDMKRMLTQSVSTLEAEIERLRALSGFIEKILDENELFTRNNTSFQLIKRDRLVLSSWFETHVDTELDARLLARQGCELPDLFEADIHYIYEGDQRLLLCTEAHDREGDVILPAGEYLAYQFTISSEGELEQHFNTFQSIADERHLHLTGTRILVEKSYLSLFTQESLHYELLAHVDREGSGHGRRKEIR
ncbi:DNA-binding transcriptional MerR regulator [Paenibacillus amylolyticus]|uniref:DNA-binding transcriptional MerR regulator n=1 Tax=Paenibacillus amylolyticus TaxID=1451 RepID=A0AAP5LK76_PAEAM|nr:MerR family transcriptional regulator [Paenibacillus amylolyticus]MDR6721686.1 DNA-binding transcriptional MerR regulator [Paenibacillus amylolyticus]